MCLPFLIISQKRVLRCDNKLTLKSQWCNIKVYSLYYHYMSMQASSRGEVKECLFCRPSLGGQADGGSTQDVTLLREGYRHRGSEHGYFSLCPPFTGWISHKNPNDSRDIRG